MYDIDSWIIATILFVSMTMAIELGYRIGLKILNKVSEPSRTHVNAIQGSLLGILALLLGFTFSLGLQRYDSRSSAVVDEANAIGTAYLRAGLLDPSVRSDAQSLLRQYLQFRTQAASVNLALLEQRSALLQQSRDLQAVLWQLSEQAIAVDDRPVTTGLFIQSLNDMFDALETRNAALNRHIPEVVLFLLYGTFLMAGCIVGFASGVSGHRVSISMYIMIALIVLLVFIIIDLDRPRRGFIEVNQSSLFELNESINR